MPSIRFAVLSILLLTKAFQLISQEKFIVHYSQESAKALDFFAKNKKMFVRNAALCGVSPEFLFSVVSPEIAWYSGYRDKFETAAVETFYIQLGSSYANFSIGWFQMKPSFVEVLEKEALKMKSWKYIAEFSCDDETKIRQERIARLKTINWQITYLCVFILHLNTKYKNVLQNEKDKLLHYASVYNCGLGASDQTIAVWQNKKAFPALFGDKKFNYSQVAIEFYEKISGR